MAYVGGKPATYPTKLSRGDSGARVKLMQELITLKGYHLAQDGEFGHATAAACLALSNKSYLSMALWRDLVSAFELALTKLKAKDPKEAIIQYAESHLFAGAQELNLNNEGPWVRLYMDGHEGKDFPWCAGFVSFIIGQMLETSTKYKEKNFPPYTMSCDELGKWATENDKLITDTNETSFDPGSVFLIKSTKSGDKIDWIHTGIVYKHNGSVIETIEGNTNIRGEREGIKVMRRIRLLNPNIHIIAL